VSVSKNLIMGFCTRLPYSRLEPFIASLRHIDFAGDVCLLVEEVSAETVERLRAHGILVERAGPSSQPRMTARASRYYNYLDFLVRHAERYAGVMLADPATTVLQANPFATPRPADVVYTSVQNRISDIPVLHGAIVQAYGEAVAHNLRDSLVSSADTTIGTAVGILRYLAAMTHQLGGRTTPIAGAMDQAVHNYLVHMRPPRGAWLDPTDRFAAVLGSVPDDVVEVSEHDVRIGGRVVPVLSNWNSSPKARTFVLGSPRFRLEDQAAPVRSRPTNAVIAYYQRQRDSTWLRLFLGSLRCVSDAIAVHCVGDFDPDEQAILQRFNCTIHAAPASEPEIAENVAHLYISQVLDRISSDASAKPEQVLVLDSMRAIFARDPFLTGTVGLSVFCEGPARIGESEYHRDRLGFFVQSLDGWLQHPIVSSMALRGSLPVVRDFYRRMLTELASRTDLLAVHEVVQGLINKLCHGGDLGVPVTAHPNGAEVYFDSPQSNLAFDTRHGIHIGGAAPALIVAEHPEAPLMLRLRIDLNLPEI
jgi:hypothetical protein